MLRTSNVASFFWIAVDPLVAAVFWFILFSVIFFCLHLFWCLLAKFDIRHFALTLFRSKGLLIFLLQWCTFSSVRLCSFEVLCLLLKWISAVDTHLGIPKQLSFGGGDSSFPLLRTCNPGSDWIYKFCSYCQDLVKILKSFGLFIRCSAVFICNCWSNMHMLSEDQFVQF